MCEALVHYNGGISIGGRKVSNLRYAEDTTPLATTQNDIVRTLKLVRDHSRMAGLYLNIKKMKIMAT